MNDYDEFYWAVAWSSLTEFSEKFFDLKHKFCCVTFGVTGCITSPDFVDKLVGIKNAKIAKDFSTGIFHPKIYGFCSKGRCAAIVGSANFTSGGLKNNCEAATLIEGVDAEQYFQDLMDYTREYAASGERVTKKYAMEYRRRYEIASRLKRPPLNPMATFPPKSSTADDALVEGLTWKQSVAKVKTSRNHNPVDSLKLLRIAQTWFTSNSSFSEMPLDKRNAICGTLHSNQELSEYPGMEWGWFGSMFGFGDLKNRLSENDLFIARAVDQIPRRGEVSQVQYEGYCDDFLKAFRDSERTGGVASASRLLAMKRPDIFFCINKQNKHTAAKALGYTMSNLKLENYWKWVVEPIGTSDWYNEPKPAAPVFEAELWENRAAMLDTFMYSP